jgi:hypothetical protein
LVAIIQSYDAWNHEQKTVKHSMGKTVNYNFAFCAVADAGEKRTCESV